MRSFETYLVIGCLVAVLWPALFGIRSRRGIVAGGLLLLVILQWQIEGYRWQLLPLYLVALGLAVGDVVMIERDLPWFRRIGRGIFGPVGLGLIIAPALILPVPELPAPPGPLAIGTTTFQLVHADRLETYGPDPGVPRRFVAQVWYPAEPAEDARPTPWEPEIDVVARALADRVGVPGFFFSQARYTMSHAFADAPVADGVFPLVIYSHELAGFKTIALAQVEALVSQGFVVAAIDHTYGAVATVIDGEVADFDSAAFENPEATPVQQVEALTLLIDTFAADITTLLDELDEGAAGVLGELAASIDGETVGLWGHGAGGGAVLQVCLTDDRCDAMAGFDPLVTPLPNAVLATTSARPMLLMRSDPQRGTENDAVLRGIVERSQTLTYWVDVLGAESSDFTAAPLVSPIADRLGLKGPIDGRRVTMINRRYLTGFFDRFLHGTGSAALDTADFAEVDVEIVDRLP